MKTQLSILALLALSLAACNSDTSTTTTTSDTAAAAPAGDANMVTTTTTTTRPAYVPKPEVKYIDLRTKKMITVRVDTVNHYIVNTVTNQPVEWIVEPGTTDTVYGRNMMIANGMINYSTSGDWTYDQSMANTGTPTTTETTSDSMVPAGKEVRKEKMTSSETKVKYRDGSKEKVTNSETKIKNK